MKSLPSIDRPYFCGFTSEIPLKELERKPSKERSGGGEGTASSVQICWQMGSKKSAARTRSSCGYVLPSTKRRRRSIITFVPKATFVVALERPVTGPSPVDGLRLRGAEQRP